MTALILRPVAAVVIFFSTVVWQLSERVNSEPTQDKQALLSFISLTPHANRVRWNASDSACNWFGVQCDPSRSFVQSLHLPAAGLVGPIPPNTIGRLTQLRVLSLHSNRLTGEIPADFSNLALLTNLYLQNNRLAGDFPPSLTRMARLTRLVLSANNFSGAIPFSINNLTHLTGLLLENNGFSGNLPSINAKLVNFNVSGNRLNGSIPDSLSGFPASSFAGNLDLCGGPLKSCNPFFPPPAPPPGKKSSKKLSTAAIVGIAVGAALILFLLLLFYFLSCCRKRPAKPPQTVAAASRAAASPSTAEAGTSSSKEDITGSAEAAAASAGRNKLVFLEGGAYSFELEDLLRASAEVLGKGSIGACYKAVLEDGTTVVVKRLEDVVIAKKEFVMQMDLLGRIQHENVVPLRAFYFSNDEKLLVYDYMSAGSLSSMLHGSRRSSVATPLDWDTRMRIALGVARGLASLHVSTKLIHGNIKSSNVLLRPNHDACVSDFGLNQIFGNSDPPNRVAGYRAPEILETRKSTFKSDVYSFGVLVLELLTGKAPNQASLGEEGVDLPQWVRSVVQEEWTAEVFDAELMRYHNNEEEMVQLLQVAMVCVSLMPDQRPTMHEVVRMIEEINRSEIDEGLHGSSDDPSRASDSHTPTSRF